MAITTYRNFDLLITRAGQQYRAFVVDAGLSLHRHGPLQPLRP
jgi:hypothetical protein